MAFPARTPKKVNSTTTEMNLKLIIDPKSRRVLFAEAGKEVVDFIFSLLYMPLASVVKLLTKEHMVGSIGSIYNSVESMAETHLECTQAKSLILNPTFASPSKFFTGSSSTRSTDVKYYKCSNLFCSWYFTSMFKTTCPNCKSGTMTTETFVGPNRERLVVEAAINTSGFVKGLVACTIADDLTVMPLSGVGTLALLSKHNIKDASLLEERRVKLGMEEGLKLLKASLTSKTVLTDVFLGVKAEPK